MARRRSRRSKKIHPLFLIAGAAIVAFFFWPKKAAASERVSYTRTALPENLFTSEDRMARRKRRFGSPPDVHKERAKSSLREIKRLTKTLRRHLADPADCATAARLAITLAEQTGAHLIDRWEGGGRMSAGGRGPRQLIGRFIDKCVLKPRSEAHKRKIHATWR
jgi:hypothetical protein